MTVLAVRLVLMVERSLFHQVLLAVGALEAVVVVRLAAILYSLLSDLILARNTARDALA